MALELQDLLEERAVVVLLEPQVPLDSLACQELLVQQVSRVVLEGQDLLALQDRLVFKGLQDNRVVLEALAHLAC